LKKIGRSGLLPAGIIITGGGSGIASLSDYAKESLKLPSRIGAIISNQDIKGSIKDSSWAVAYGLCIAGLNSDDNEPSLGMRHIARTTKNRLVAWVKQFLP
jgi:cell division ATPase FtsA